MTELVAALKLSFAWRLLAFGYMNETLRSELIVRDLFVVVPGI